MSDSRTGAGKMQMSWEHFVVPESKKMFKLQRNRGLAKRYRSQPERAANDQSWNNLSKIK